MWIDVAVLGGTIAFLNGYATLELFRRVSAATEEDLELEVIHDSYLRRAITRALCGVALVAVGMHPHDAVAAQVAVLVVAMLLTGISVADWWTQYRAERVAELRRRRRTREQKE